jgi:ABC-type Na+ efflux pump permease subunit
MAYTHFKALVWKEIVEGRRVLKWTIPGSVLMVLVMQCLPLAQLAQSAKDPIAAAFVQAFLPRLMLFIPLMVVPFVGNLMVHRAIYGERKDRTIAALLASGVSPPVVWLAKFTVAALVGYVSSAFTLAGYWLFVNLYLGLSLACDIHFLASALIVVPVIALGVLAVMSVTYWWVQNGQLVGMLFPIVSLMGVWIVGLNDQFGDTTALTNWTSVIPGVLMVVFSCVGMEMISKERVAGA